MSRRKTSQHMGFAALKLAKGLYIIPFLFDYTALLFEGPIYDALINAMSASLGPLAFTAVIEWHFARRVILWNRGLVGLATIDLLWPHTTIRIIGFLIFSSVYTAQNLPARRGA